jgi:hypothetical protein
MLMIEGMERLNLRFPLSIASFNDAIFSNMA